MKRSITVRTEPQGRSALPRRPIIRYARLARNERECQKPQSRNSRKSRLLKNKKLPNEPILEFSICLQTKEIINKCIKPREKTNPFTGPAHSMFSIRCLMFDVHFLSVRLNH